MNARRVVFAAALLVIAEKVGRRTRCLESFTWKDALWFGVFQALSVFPGISRSGAIQGVGIFSAADVRHQDLTGCHAGSRGDLAHQPHQLRLQIAQHAEPPAIGDGQHDHRDGDDQRDEHAGLVERHRQIADLS